MPLCTLVLLVSQPCNDKVSLHHSGLWNLNKLWLLAAQHWPLGWDSEQNHRAVLMREGIPFIIRQKCYISSKSLSQKNQTFFCEDYLLYPDLKKIFSKHAKYSQVYQLFYLLYHPASVLSTVLHVVLWVPLTFISSPTYLIMSGGKQNFLKYSQNCEVAKLIFLYEFLLF